MLENFPKTRPSLPPEYARIYFAHYKSNRAGATLVSSLSSRLERWMHRQVARDVARASRPRSTLELGAGTLNHLKHEVSAGPYDIVEPLAQFYEDSPLLAKIRNRYADIAEVPSDASYDRIVAIATFEHICDLPLVVARSGLLLAPEGVLRASIPSEGTPLWRMGWMLTTGVEFRLKYGLDYGSLLMHEHVNTAAEVEYVLRYFFRQVESRVFGLSKYFSLYQAYFCRNPDLAECRAYLRNAGGSGQISPEDGSGAPG